MTMTHEPKRHQAGSPQGGGRFAPDLHPEAANVALLAPQHVTHTAPLTGTIELQNADFDTLPDWPAGMAEPTVSFEFENGKVQTLVTVEDKMMTFWTDDTEGTLDSTYLSDTPYGDPNPWQDFDAEDQDLARDWGKRVHERIDSATYGIMMEATRAPAVNDIILAQALGKEPAAPAVPDLTNEATRNAYLFGAEARLAAAHEEVQNVYMIGAAVELREGFPVIDSFRLAAGDEGLEIAEAWDADGNAVDGDTVYQAEQSVFRYRDEDDFNTFTGEEPDEKIVNVAAAIAFRSGS
jgi:hypothetical protein